MIERREKRAFIMKLQHSININHEYYERESTVEREESSLLCCERKRENCGSSSDQRSAQYFVFTFFTISSLHLGRVGCAFRFFSSQLFLYKYNFFLSNCIYHDRLRKKIISEKIRNEIIG